MHPALTLDNLKRLPPTLRSAANAAISPNRSVADLRRVQRHLATATESQFIWTLPVFYINLDPAAIPSLDEFDTKAPSSDAVSAIGRAFCSLEELSVMRFPESAGVYIWPRFWPWAQFIHLYRDYLPGIPPQREDDFCRALLSFTVTLTHHRDTHARIVSTPWFWYLLGRTWSHLPAIKDPSKQDLAVNDIAFFLIEEGITKPPNMDEFLSGVGGTLADVARLVISFTDCILPKGDAALDDRHIHFLAFILIFVCFVDPALAAGAQPMADLGQFGKALLERNFIGVLIKAICSLSKSVIRDALHPAQKAVELLATVLQTRDGYSQILAAIDEGLLRALILAAQSDFADDLDHEYFVRLLRRFLFHHRYLSALGRALEGIINLLNTAAFRQCKTYKLWNQFFSVARERLEVLTAVDSSKCVRNVACDNLQCCEIGVKTEFRRCSDCQSMYYCSKTCQIMNWRHGGHRETCNSYGKLLLSAKNSFGSTARQRSFPACPSTSRLSLGAAQVTVFDYTQGEVWISVEPRTVLDTVEGFSGVEWTNIVSREAASNGTMEIHVVVISGLKGCMTGTALGQPRTC
ncbi:MYND-type domain-containing protein [Mycena sanguinolenta]|uniref:MYND-type domain-containing protein n=1 Tax=Mycena sanguinolenta TaxID=230812 RepID=A0A8H6ZBZ3_9AGAR|nr:MYND-type domain-containing protein [Mycena sanguinolenta]